MYRRLFACCQLGPAAFGAVAALCMCGQLYGQTGNVPIVDFPRQVEPILAKRCFACHGPDKAQGGLRLNSRKGALVDLDSGSHAIVPGKPDESELVRRITATDESQRMPPEGKPLSDDQIAVIRRWISEGASWPEHWAFRPVKPQLVPQVKRADWVRNPIDAFIASRLEQAALAPAPAADRAALLRRVSYDLTGLPPSPAEVDAFLADTSVTAYEKLVDRLLASSHYGERWGRHWLDAVRYAETNSFERDTVKPNAWRYRDYVIRSFNEDKPYDQFVREQLAGDELPKVTNETMIATGYYRLGIWDDEPADRLQAQFDVLDDIVSTTSQVFLGLTAGCARCHDHKIDPIPQKDYYSMLAFFHGIKPYLVSGPNIEMQVFGSAEEQQQCEIRIKDLDQRRDEVQVKRVALEDKFQSLYNTNVPPAEQVQRPDIEDLEFREYRERWEKLPDFDAIRNAARYGALPHGLIEITPVTGNNDFGMRFRGILWVPADGEYTFSLDSDDGSRLLLDNKLIVEYDGLHGLGSPRVATAKLQAGRHNLRFEYFQNSGAHGVVLSWSGPGFSNRPLSTLTPPPADKTTFARVLEEHGAKTLGDQQFAEFKGLVERLDALKKEVVEVPKALIVTEVGPRSPDTFVLLRGNAHVNGDPVEPAFPAVLSATKPQIPPATATAKSSGRRLALANWIASPENRLTSRVMVNRIWQFHFGRGIVRSPNNFGQVGDPPTHPELLDWLAGEFVRGGWSMKHLHRLILTSNAYRMSSRADANTLAKDPTNDLFSRFDMRRLSGEEIRDSVYAVTGLFNPQKYGPPIYPEISAEVMAGQSRPGEGWGKSSPAEQARRSIYIHVKRSLITPILADFDFADTDATCPARFATTQPTQALDMLNGNFINGQAAALAERLRREAGTDSKAQVTLALRLALCRPADDKSIERGLAFMKSIEQKHAIKPDKSLDYFCLMLLNLNEFIYLD